MEDDHTAWLERVLNAADRSAKELHERNDPQVRALVRDLEELRDRLRAEVNLDRERGST